MPLFACEVNILGRIFRRGWARHFIWRAPAGAQAPLPASYHSAGLRRKAWHGVGTSLRQVAALRQRQQLRQKNGLGVGRGKQAQPGRAEGRGRVKQVRHEKRMPMQHLESGGSLGTGSREGGDANTPPHPACCLVQPHWLLRLKARPTTSTFSFLPGTLNTGRDRLLLAG